MEEPQRQHIYARTVACIHHEGSHDDIGSVYRRLFAWAKDNAMEPVGSPFTVFSEPLDALDWKQSRFTVCLPVPVGTAAGGEVAVKDVPAVDVMTAVVRGPYSEIPAHYTELLSWIDYGQFDVAGPPREVYVVYPAADGSGDPATFETEIQFPINIEG
ncbi:GyrI-like domain-containing protein [bacterium]|nr:GyrI-like domain-containing protein [bacterium]